MLAYRCVVCHEEAKIICSPAKDLTLGVAQTCLRCGADLAVLLVVVKKEKLINYLERRVNRGQKKEVEKEMKLKEVNEKGEEKKASKKDIENIAKQNIEKG